jgi:hypothetical protein
MHAIDKMIFTAACFEQMLETLLFTAAAVVVTGATVAMCVPGVFGLA